MTDIHGIKRMLADRAQSVAEHLLPNGCKEGSEWRAGSTSGEPGKSLAVHLSGDKAGIWADFNTGEKGDLLDLWGAVRGLTLPEVLEDARGWLGIQRPELTRPVKKSYARPPKPKCAQPRGRVRDYLTEDRNLPDDVLSRYKIGEDGTRIIFPFLLPDGELAMAKAREATDGAKPVPTAKDCEPVLFGWQAIPDNARELVITEGEIDTLSMAAYGFPAMSVPFGGGGGAKQRWIENEFDRLERFERIHIATDMDQPGDEAADEIADRLGRHRCFRVSLPRKDVNGCLIDGIPQAEIAAAIANARGLGPEGLRRPGEYADDIVSLFWPQPGEHEGYRMPYDKLAGKLAFRLGEVTLWSGTTGAGKSQILSDCVVDFIEQGSGVCLSSLEMKPAMTLKRMVKQTLGVDRPPEPAIRQALKFLDRGLWLYERVGKAGVEGLLEVFDYARARYGCDQFVIDSLMRLGIAGDDYTGQEQAMYRLVDWTIEKNVHLHLVAHSRKTAADQIGASEDVKGAMEVGANAANILIIWRNRALEESPEEAEGRPPVVLNVAKQRNGDFEGKAGLWFDRECYRYRDTEKRSIVSRDYLGLIKRSAA